MDPKVELLFSQASSLITKFEQEGETVYINEAIVLDRQALDLCPPTHPMRSVALTRLARDLLHHYSQLGGIDDLNEAVDLGRETLVFHPSGHPDRPTSMNNLATNLATRYKHLGGIDDLNEAIILAQNTLVFHPPGHPDRSTSLNNLAAYLSAQYDRIGGIDSLNEAINFGREALALRPPGHSERSSSLNNLARHLSSRYKQLGGINDLNEAIVFAQDALSLRPPGYPGRPRALINLAAYLSTRYEQLGGIDNLNKAIVLGREAMSLCPRGSPDRLSSLNNLALHLSVRYKELEGHDDLDEAISLAQDTLDLCPPRHPDRSRLLINLASYLSTRYKQRGRIDDINQAVDLSRDALELRPPGHPRRLLSLNNLAFHLSARYKQVGRVDDISEAIVLARDTLVLCPPRHPDRSGFLNNLGLHLSIRHKQLGAIGNDLDEAIIHTRDALSLRPPGHPERSKSLQYLAEYLGIRFKQLNDVRDQEAQFSLYIELEHAPPTVSSLDLSAAKAWVDAAERIHHSSTLLAYKTALRLLVQHLATLPSLPQHLVVLKSLTSSLAVDAFSACLRGEAPASAVELLEQGRGIFWSQLTRLRSPLDDIVSLGPAGKVLADEFTRLTSLIRSVLSTPAANQHDRLCHLNLGLQGVVSSIRELPGSSRFLLPPSFPNLQCAASGGPVIILNASKYSRDALVVFADKDPVHLPLSVTKARVQELAARLHELTKRSKLTDVSRDVYGFLRELWNEIVSHIVAFLQMICPPQSRIWWCPTAEFSLLPLHAANPYKRGHQSLADLYISSYTPTLTALIRARRSSPSNPATGTKRIVAIGQADAVDTCKLASVGVELTTIGRRIDSLATFTRIEGEDSSIPRVIDEFNKNEWVHLACHGLPNQKRPFESAFALHDGRLTIQRIIQCDLKNSEFAYLSACHTTVGDEENSDEAIHLASAMQFAGFRSVIGTMWVVDDEQTNKMTSIFYTHMVDESGRLDHTRAAFALWKTMKSVKIPVDQRILYIHLGA